MSPLAADAPTAHPRSYLVSYRLKLAKLRYGRIASVYFAAAVRRFETDELNVILAELYAEVGPSPCLLGLEISSVGRGTASAWARP
ncbi:MAG: hypothetical protein ACRYG7_19630 [Janthinobacterium lividum]